MFSVYSVPELIALYLYNREKYGKFFAYIFLQQFTLRIFTLLYRHCKRR